MSARFDNLHDWLRWQETLHPEEIELGLARIAAVFQRLQASSFSCPVITIAGTNGKGSSLRMLESIYLAEGYRTCVYSSPHLLRYNERIRINGEEAADADIVAAFARIDAARADISLTYFEFGTLAALDIFMRQQVDVVLLEVGLGGRLDAVNIIDADVALLTAISLDHTDWLGEDREAIGYEKAGILRSGKPTVCSDPDLPQSVQAHAGKLDCPLYRLGYEFDFKSSAAGWCWYEHEGQSLDLPPPGLQGAHQYRNAAGVLMALTLLQSRLPVAREAIRRGLLATRLPGRFQRVAGQPLSEPSSGRLSWIYDVAHNPDSVQQLAHMLAEEQQTGRTFALLGMLADKDSRTALKYIHSQITDWHIAPLNSRRSEKPENLRDIIHSLGCSPVSLHTSVAQAWEAIERRAESGDRIVVFGSFYTVSEAMVVAQAHGQRI
ncbi:Dihydrofolate synthase @ Folylpolyglutamate synthase [hydrothermal vent metagenome]|uniref:Dihydrofolate synthase @ Folylpolyglutamate synthase n=1 Tax=hydrothermal vent metagenome TaxID=652676 RepID=A0A3B1B8E7_9ZZZZ